MDTLYAATYIPRHYNVTINFVRFDESNWDLPSLYFQFIMLMFFPLKFQIVHPYSQHKAEGYAIFVVCG